jgi:DNA-binding response OmpR family regulator
MVSIIGLSMYDDELSTQKMRQAGAVDYRGKGCSGTELLAAIRACKDAWKSAEDPVLSAKTPFKSTFI